MSEIATVNHQAELIGGLRSDVFKQQIAVALPEGITPDRFVRIAITAVQQNPDLAGPNVDRDSVIRSFIQSAQVGLFPDGHESAIVLFGNKATFMAMIAGYRKIAAEHGWTIQTRIIYQNDDFEHEYGLEENIVHRPTPIGADRGVMVGAYAIAKHKDGRREFVVMSAAEIAKIRQVAKSKTIWDQWPDAMAEKTVGRQMFKRLPLDPADRQRVAAVIAAEEFEPGEARDLLYGPSGHPVEVREIEAAPVLVDEVVPEQEPVLDPPADPTLEVDDEARMLADEAGMFVPPSGTYSETGPKGPMTLVAMAADENGRKYLGMLLKRLEPTLENQGYVEAVWAFCRVYCPELVQAAEVQS